MTFVIAEAGVNHNGSRELAQKLIDAAKECGADAVKFQAFTAERLDPPGARRDMIKRVELSKDDLRYLAEHTEFAGIEFMVTPFDAEWCRWCADNLPLKRIKIASGCLWDIELLDAAAVTGLPVIISAGLTNYEEFEDALCALRYGDITVLHCVSEYPATTDRLCISRIGMWKNPLRRGLSDHSLSILAPAIAVTLGATVIEKHLTLSRNQDGPDHRASLEPHEFAEMVRLARESETLLGIAEPWPPHPEPAATVKKERMEWRRTLSA